MGIITCPGEDAGYCDSIVRKGYEGPCEKCPLVYISSFEEYRRWHEGEEVS